MSNRASLAVHWQKFAQEVIPPTAGQNQREWLQDAYYAGAAVMFWLLNQVDEGAAVTEADMEWVASLHDEVEAYARKRAADATEASSSRPVS